MTVALDIIYICIYNLYNIIYTSGLASVFATSNTCLLGHFCIGHLLTRVINQPSSYLAHYLINIILDKSINFTYINYQAYKKFINTYFT